MKNMTSENYEIYKKAADSLKRNLRFEKQLYIAKSIKTLHDWNTRQMFYCNSSVIDKSRKRYVIFSLAENDTEKANLLACLFSQQSQHPKLSDKNEEHCQYVEDEIYSVVQMSRKTEFSEYQSQLELNQSYITEDEVIDSIRHLSAYKSQGPDNVYNLMLKNVVQSLIDSLVMMFGCSYKIGYFPKALKKSNTVSNCDNDLNAIFERAPNVESKPSNKFELLLILSESIHASFNKNVVTYAAMLDISPAYDIVWCDGLRSSLSSLLFMYINDITHEAYEQIQFGVFAYDIALWISIYASDQVFGTNY
ncbi:hypothetical protein RFI_10892 [Reticulomyxa filosa]|uniref:Uncharacterized protein n=1 Tax=Reticulomyxa filosa TaxID=46433 RepID=X6NKH6_RETFI|nr:hypothetical protein RFI_10892 [Reticulomyxa filosa]|eukprot:ETO26244.1 hypothetical protein RFI_10892 [Reticulomyxa filosa]